MIAVPTGMTVACRQCGPLAMVEPAEAVRDLHISALCPECGQRAHVVGPDGKRTGPWFIPRNMLGLKRREGFWAN